MGFGKCKIKVLGEIKGGRDGKGKI
jgi:hypothetical protein